MPSQDRLHYTSRRSSWIFSLAQWFSAFLIPWPFNRVSHAAVNSSHKIALLLLPNCNLAAVMSGIVNICLPLVLDKPCETIIWPHRLRTRPSKKSFHDLKTTDVSYEMRTLNNWEYWGMYKCNRCPGLACSWVSEIIKESYVIPWKDSLWQPPPNSCEPEAMEQMRQAWTVSNAFSFNVLFNTQLLESKLHYCPKFWPL